jgi:hypothetical protein
MAMIQMQLGKPDFFIVGASKCGTTALSALLDCDLSDWNEDPAASPMRP